MRVARVIIPAIIAYLVYIFSLTILSHVGFPKDMQSGLSLSYPYLADKPVGEDGYYMLTVAWNIASGRGIVYNYDMPTTGIQPLSTAVYAMLAWIIQFIGGDKWLYIRIILFFGSITLLVFGHIVGTIARNLSDTKVKDLSYALGFIGTVFNYALFRWFNYGLETGIYLICFALCILYSLSLTQKSKFGIREAIVLGILGGVTVLARIDFGVVFLLFLGISVIRHQFKFFWVVVTGTITTLIVSPWFLYVFYITGSWLPSSGPAQASLITMQSAPYRLWRMGKDVLSLLTPWIYSYPGGVFSLAALISLIAFLVFLFRKRGILNMLSSKIKYHPHFINWLVGATTLIFIYVVFFWSGHFYQRYSAPIVVPLTAIIAMTVAERIRLISKAFQVIILYTLPVCFFGSAFINLHTGRTGNGHSVTAGFVKNYFSSVKVGAFQSGVIGYFNSNVINLDGKVNQMALDYKTNKLHFYIDSEKINVLVEWRDFLYSSLDSDWLISNWDMCEEQVPNGASICLQRKTISEVVKIQSLARP
jgi:hypothetical protein